MNASIGEDPEGLAKYPKFDYGDELDLLVIQQEGQKGFMKGSVRRRITIDAEHFIGDVEEYR